MKVPALPPETFRTLPEHLRQFDGPLWRVFRTEGDHPQAWDELRHYGPVRRMRFDPHPLLPMTLHPDVGVMYAATKSHTALGEAFQSTRVIDRSKDAPAIVSWVPSRPLTLLDLTTNWPVLNGAAASMMMDDKKHTQAWARAIVEQDGLDIDGLYHHSSINNEPLVTLFSGVERRHAFPTRPQLHVLLKDSSADVIVHRATKLLGYRSI